MHKPAINFKPLFERELDLIGKPLSLCALPTEPVLTHVCKDLPSVTRSLVQCFCLWNCTSLKTALPFYNLNTADQDNSIINYMRYHIFYDNACSIYYVQNRCMFGIDRYTNNVLLRYFAMRCCNLFIFFAMLQNKKHVKMPT